jgi:hypothetical protein
MPPKRKRDQVIPNHRYLQFDVFDALGLDPNPTLSRRDINKAYARAVLIVHPDHQASNKGFVPTFPTVQQAQNARDYLLGADHRLQRAHGLLWQNHKSTWNPAAPRGTAEILQPRDPVIAVPETTELPDSPGSPGGRRGAQPQPTTPPPPPTGRGAKKPKPTPQSTGGKRGTKPSKQKPPPRGWNPADPRWSRLYEFARPNRIFVGYVSSKGAQWAVEGGMNRAGALTLLIRNVDMRGNRTRDPPTWHITRDSEKITWVAPFRGHEGDRDELKRRIGDILATRPVDLTGDS